jgi:ornithine cyclodeaminase/alanine dehydrogenase-like protein (mu-crystallin family)
MTKPGLLWLREQDVVELVTLNDAIDALENVLALEGEGRALNVPKALATWGKANSLHALASAMTDAPYCGTKTWVNTPAGAVAIYALFDGIAGSLLAVIEANALGSLRTAAASGVATRWMADPAASEFAIVGSGRQALLQVAAIAAVRPLRRIRVFSPTRDNQLRFATRLRGRFDMPVETPATLEETLAGAEITTVVTRARAPFLHADMLPDRAHLNAVGAILPGNAELYPDVLERAGAVVVDNLANVKLASRELMDFYGPGESWDKVEALGARIAAGRRHMASDRLTVFKSVGMGLADLALASRAYEAAQAAGLGMPIERATPATPTWRVHGAVATTSEKVA